ncbi:glycerate kinase type-2 family protein [Halobellus limi]|uniref:DUF4147 domain-containing protein n=1 Tax=Halobellus limi TaxID=699433 RepID=A0A1H5ZKK0_9EURY|nr:DUF4147 domain-containing protein [Halobellus limi]QCC48048.1 DUF4147 domain-containing protein [Halobellus limi]SEG37063.1 hydroxypyruvate reductase [Halobellus limi]
MTETGDRSGSTPTDIARAAARAGIEAAHPEAVLQEALAVDGNRLRIGGRRYDLADYDEVLVLGGGNAAGTVASHLADRLGSALTGGLVVTDDPSPAGPVETVTGTHPVPSEANVEGARRLVERAAAADEHTLVLAPVTGGGSALLAAPVDGVSLADLRELTEALLRSGAPIDRINAVRKHVSAVKGGQLARTAAPATTVGLVFSDVASDDPSVVASGPLSPDPTTYDDALDVLAEYGVDAPASVLDHLRAGADGDVPETPGSDDAAFESASVHVVADNRTAVSAAREVCREAGFETLVLSSSVRGEAREAAKTHAAVAEEIRRSGNPLEPPAAVLSGGETTVTIRGDGTGGPNQEFALSAALELGEPAVLCAVDTDGLDGPTDAAGAVVDERTVEDPRRARSLLADNDVYDYLDERGALVRTGQTGTNVNDLRVLLVAE